jgi:hypothetical protein
MRTGTPARPVALAATRRGFLRLAGSAAACTALAQLRVFPAAAPAAAAEGARFFSPQETEILTQLMERVVDTGLPEAPSVRETGAVASVDRLCATLAPEVSDPLPLLLRLFEWGPLLFDLTPSRFTRLDAARKDASLRGWMESRIGLRRLAFTGLRNLCFVGYYSQPETWPLIGYLGPLRLRPGEVRP